MAKPMRKYIGVKIVDASPMGAQEAFASEHKVGKADRDLNSDGYEVTYPNGYKSWCPAGPFEDANRLFGTFVERMAVELGDLKEKIAKLSAFTVTDVFAGLTQNEQYLLDGQLRAMAVYHSFLEERYAKAK